MAVDYQDVLAELGASSAHPGGHGTTLEWLQAIPWRRSMKVLDVGCGTGRTLLHIRNRYGCDIYGVDVRKKMIQKAKTRSAKSGNDGHWKVASAERLPFADETFDVTLTESVNVFVDSPAALKEYLRVLKPSGWYVDVEMLVLGPVNEQWKESVAKVYGTRGVPDQRGWKQQYEQAGFEQVHVLMTKPVRPLDMASAEQIHPDEVDLSTPGAYQNPRVLNVLRENSEWLDRYHHSLGYGIFIARKRASEG